MFGRAARARTAAGGLPVAVRNAVASVAATRTATNPRRTVVVAVTPTAAGKIATIESGTAVAVAVAAVAVAVAVSVAVAGIGSATVGTSAPAVAGPTVVAERRPWTWRRTGNRRAVGNRTRSVSAAGTATGTVGTRSGIAVAAGIGAASAVGTAVAVAGLGSGRAANAG